MNIRGNRTAVVLALMVVLCLGTAVGGDAASEDKKPTATPTPRPEGGQSLNEVAKDKQLKGGEEGKGIVISNENLADYADKGRLTGESTTSGTSAGRRPVRPGGTDVRVTDPTSPQSHTDERKRYWQNQYQTQLELIGTLRNQITLLDNEIPGLWRDFYNRDDPFYRDGVIKPKLDQMIAQRQSLEEDLAEAEPRLSKIKEEARRDGAEPGWFRGMTVPTPIPAAPTPGRLMGE